MAKTRYAIVKVNNHCPSRFVDNVRNEYVCKTKQTRGGYILNCIGCRYGDTKEQMIQKILQAIIIDIVKTAKVNDKKTIQILYKANYKLAKFIVEFLGVE